MASGVPFQIQKALDNMGAYREAFTEATVGRTSLWLMAYNAGSSQQAYIDAVLNSTLLGVDTSMNNVVIGQSTVGNWFALHNAYIQNVLSIVATGPGGVFDAWLTQQGWRVSQYLNRLYIECSGSYLTLTNVWPQDDLNLGSHVKTADVFTLGSAVNLTQASMGRIQAVVPTGTTIGASSYAVTATLTRVTGAGLVLVAAIPNASTAGTSVIYGQQVLSGGAASGQKVIPVAATAQFLAGEYALIYDTVGNQEWVLVASVSLNTSITTTNNLINTYTTGNSAKVAPMFSGVTAATCSGTGASGDTVNFKIAPDRVISLTGSA